MIRDWESEKYNLVNNYDRLRLKSLRKRLRGFWTVAGKTKDEIAMIDSEKKNQICKHLYQVYAVFAAGDRIKKEMKEQYKYWGK